MDDAQMQTAVEEIAWRLVHAGCSESRLKTLLCEARERGRFGLRDVLVAFALVRSYPTHPWQGVASSVFAEALADVFDPLDVDLWCMELTEDATSVAGQDVYGAHETCALIVYGKSMYMCYMQDRPLVAVTYARQRCRSGFLRMLEEREASELMARTIPVALCTIDINDSQKFHTLFAPFLQTCTLGPESMRKLVACCVRAHIDIVAVLHTDSAHCLADDAHMAAMALVAYKTCTDEFRAWAQRARDTMQDNPEALYKELSRSVASSPYQRWLFAEDGDLVPCTPFLCSMLDEKHRVKMRSDLRAVVKKVCPGAMGCAQLARFTAQVRDAIAACEGTLAPSWPHPTERE